MIGPSDDSPETAVSPSSTIGVEEAVKPGLKRVFYGSAGRANLIDSHGYWARGENNPDQTSITFSGQVEDFVDDIGAEALMVSDHPDGRRLQDGRFTIEHWPAPAGTGIAYYLAQFRVAIRMVRAARRFGADVALLDSGTTQFFMMAIFPLFGIAVIPILHNALWPEGFPPKSVPRRLVRALDRLFWRFGPRAVIAVSPAVERQVRQMAGHSRTPIYQAFAQFERSYFDKIAPAQPSSRPFRFTFVGRLSAEKGAFDVPLIAREVEASAPGLIHWTICGGGPDLEPLQRQIKEMGLDDVVDARGWTSPAQLRDVYGASHASIVPTRSSFAEGLAMTAVEAVLSGRPLITSKVVPAIELLRPAAVEAHTDDVSSYAAAAIALASDAGLYGSLSRATGALGAPFYDRTRGLRQALHRASTAVAVR